jgi:hypothetical protein
VNKWEAQLLRAKETSSSFDQSLGQLWSLATTNHRSTLAHTATTAYGTRVNDTKEELLLLLLPLSILNHHGYQLSLLISGMRNNTSSTLPTVLFPKQLPNASLER